ncbi:GFA family protein [Ruegeria sp. HKCCD4315]|nr:GFA family protein [Ruegeria sp. HKCCD4332]NOD88683.1 GFA family protein [Ruegeria sp. HKCCD4318]NOE12089.1 GFA family protein [Ruegeria sp. HKCCD4318-2]NOG09747.1 GFA family protein [Ruegeria sp. HKCCD4315]
MKQFRGSCHCGSVEFTFSVPDIDHAMRCDCSLCSRKGMVMSATVVPPEDIKIRCEQGVLSTYQFGTETARHYFCNRCGIHTFVETRLNPGHYRVNLGCIDELDALRLPEVIYDGRNL